MAKFFDRKTTTITVSEFYENFVLKKYDFSPKYQRLSVWSEEKKSFLIDSILKNYPIPAIFLRPRVDSRSGKTTYDVVDGKQRLETIIGFIENQVALTTYFNEDDFIDSDNSEIASDIAGLKFEEIKQQSEKFADYIKQFWTYSINIELLYEQNDDLIPSVFDRLNRNGEPLTRQELRKAQYSDSLLYSAISDLAGNDFWNNKISRLNSDRMENIEFVSEIFFMVLKREVLSSPQDVIDKLYKDYENNKDAVEETQKNVLSIIEKINNLSIDFNSNKKLCSTTHLYTLFSFVQKLIEKNVAEDDIGKKVNEFYCRYFSKNYGENDLLQSYKDASSSRTGSDRQRLKRLNALADYCKVSIK